MKTSLKSYRSHFAGVALLAGVALTALPVEAAPDWGAYHDQTSAQHQAKTNWFVANGFRPISLSVYGTPGSPRYAAVWVKMPGAPYQLWHGLSAGGYQKKLEEGWEDGYRPTMGPATGTGAGGNANFACVLQKDGKPFIARHGLEWSTVYYLNDQYRHSGWILTWIDGYATDQFGRYTAIWEKNTTGADWKVHANLSAATVKDFVDSYLKQGYRVAHIAVLPNQKYTVLWHTGITGLRKVHWGMTSAQYQKKTVDLKNEGYRPISVQAGGSGSATRFAAIYVKD